MGLGKWIFVGLGWALGGPIGGILAYLLGSQFSSDSQPRISDNPHRGRYHNTGSVGDLNAALMVLVAAVMKADGTVQRAELDYVKRFLLQNYGEEKGKELLHLLRDMVKREIPVAAVCAQIKVNTDYTTRYHILDFLFGLAGSDLQFAEKELSTLRTIASCLGINSGDYASIYARHVGSGSGHYSSGQNSSIKDPFAILGLTKEASDEEVKKAYRRLAMKYHPDRVDAMDEAVKKNAEAQFRTINEAYEEIKRLRGMK